MSVEAFRDAGIYSANALIYKHDRNENIPRKDWLLNPDYWQVPEVSLDLGTGDCEDFALLCLWKLWQQVEKNIDTYVIVGLYDPDDENSWHAWSGLDYVDTIYHTDATRPLGYSGKYYPPFGEEGYLRGREQRYRLKYSPKYGLSPAQEVN